MVDVRGGGGGGVFWLYAAYMADQYRCARPENAQVVSWYMKRDAPPLQVSSRLKEKMATASMKLRFRWSAKHVAGAANKMEDALGRGAWADVNGTPQ